MRQRPFCCKSRHNFKRESKIVLCMLPTFHNIEKVLYSLIFHQAMRFCNFHRSCCNLNAVILSCAEKFKSSTWQFYLRKHLCELLGSWKKTKKKKNSINVAGENFFIAVQRLLSKGRMIWSVDLLYV